MNNHLSRFRQALHAEIGRLLSPLGSIVDRRRGRTSVTDKSPYIRVCERAVRDPDTFATFKRHPDYTSVLEHVTCDEGVEYLRLALEQTPLFAGQLDYFRENDRLGAPLTCEYGEQGTFSPTTLRYVKVMSDLVALFGSLDGLRIAEIGCGYGGQCFATHVAARPTSYTLIDLEPCLRLQQIYLRELGVANVRFVPADQMPSEATYDLVVSNYAFSELTRDVQEHYLTHIVQRSTRGYLTYNWTSPLHFRSLTPGELLAAVAGSTFLPEVPLTAPDNRIWVWGTNGNVLAQ